MVNKKTRKVLCTDFTQGKTHDYALFKNSRVHFKKDTNTITDSGYQGIKDIHDNSTTPQKKSKLHPLTKAQKRANHQLASDRVLNEHVIGALKRFRIIAEKYRNRRKRFGLRFNLIVGIYNLQVG